MNNYKVKVNNEAESREVIFLGEQLGYARPHPQSYISMKNGGYVCLGFNYDGAQEDLILLVGGFKFKESDMNDIKDYKELTIPQLRDLVVLKRNDVGDKTHYCDSTNSDYFVSSENAVYFFDDEKTNSWKISNYNLSELNPIEKREMKEFLEPHPNGKYVFVKSEKSLHPSWVEIPKGENVAYKDLDDGFIYFTRLEMGYRDVELLWQRDTKPEELPFVDDEPKRENNHYFINVSDVDEVDFYEIAKRYNVADPAIQHILKKCLAIGNRGHKDLETDLRDILKSAKRALEINGFSL